MVIAFEINSGICFVYIMIFGLESSTGICFVYIMIFGLENRPGICFVYDISTARRLEGGGVLVHRNAVWLIRHLCQSEGGEKHRYP